MTMTQDEQERSDNVKVSAAKASADKRSKQRKGRILKVIVRRLPPSMCEDDFIEQISPLPEHESFYFVPADSSGMSGTSFSRAYIAFRDHQEVLNFRDKWDGYVFLDERGQDYPAIVEFAPFQKMPRKKPKKADNKNGTIEQDAEFQKFVETMDIEEEVELPSLEATVEELERRDRELRANNGVPNVLTPLIEYVLAKKMEKLRMREERREEKKRKDAERKRADKRRNKRDHTGKTARENAIREESDEDAMSIDDDPHRMVDLRQRVDEVSGRGNERDRGNTRDRATGGGGGGDRGVERSGELNRDKPGRRERNRRGNKENKKGQKSIPANPSDNNNNRGVNDDEEMSGPSPLGVRPAGARDRADRDKDHRDGVDRHAKYYDDAREPKTSNQRRNARAHDGEGDNYTDEPKPSRRDKKGRDRTRDKGKTAGNDNTRNENRRNRGNDKDDRRDAPQRDEDDCLIEDKVDRIEGRRHADQDERANDQYIDDRRQRADEKDIQRDLAGPSIEKDDRTGRGTTEVRDKEQPERRDRPDRNERQDRRGGDNQKKGNQRERRDNARKKDADKDADYRDGISGGVKPRPPKITAGGRNGADRREDRAPTTSKKDQPKPVSKRYSDTRPTPPGKLKTAAGDGEDAAAKESSNRAEDEGSGEARVSEAQGMRPIPRPAQKDDGGKKLRNKFRPSMEIYKPGSARRRNDPDREAKSSSPDLP